MESLKIVIGKSKGVAKQARELFKELGYYVSEELYDNCYGWVISDCEGEYTRDIEYFNNHHAKLVNVEQLRDLVVLKRNDVGDATHIRGDGKIYFHAKSTDCYYQFSGDGEWLLSTWMNYQLLPQLKPIEKKEMKEFLEPHPNGKYVFVNAEKPFHPSWIEIPEGAEKATISKENRINFWKENGLEWFSKVEGDWCEYGNMEKHINIHGHEIVWQRHTQPEELPSVDDEPKQTIENTLKERQGQYGGFEDVATVTQDLLGILQRTGFNSLPKPHKEALHMICSKMARLVNGDFDHVDSWHDIGGYAKLIEDMIKSEKV